MIAEAQVNILIVDDHPENLMALEAVLDSPQYNLVRANSGEEALKHLLKDEFAMILLDVQMPGLSGFDAAQLIRAREKTSQVPIIFITAISKATEHVLQGYSLGAVDYIFKPFNAEILKHKVEWFVRLHREREQIKLLNQKLMQEIAERKQAEEAIKALNQSLESRASELDAYAKELESFSYSVSHDLRAPLRSIDGFSQALLEEYEGKLDVTGQDYLKRVRVASQRMGLLIDDLLNLSRVTRYELNFSEVNLSNLAEKICTELQRVQPERQVQYKIKPGIIAQGDARLLRIGLENLLNNAWKFTSQVANAVIQFDVTVQDDRNVYYIYDNGAGFDMTYADKLFGVFQRLHPTTEFCGTGIGLATVKRIIQRHGGEVWAESQVGQGATFYFTLENKENRS